MTPRLQSALIHHRLQARAAHRQQLHELCDLLGVPLIEIMDQPSLVVDRVGFAHRLWVLGRHWLKSAADGWFQWRSGRDSLIDALSRCLAESFRSMVRLALATPEVWASVYRSCLVEMVLVQKHMAAWQVALQGDAEWLLVFEDDAQIQPETELRFRQFLASELCHLDPTQCLYCDLAGGYEPYLVLPTAVGWDPGLKRWSFSHIRTNTICSYLASRQLLVCMLSMARRYPLIRQLPADHLINLAALLGESRGQTSRSLHWREPFFRHGSFYAGLTSTVSGVR